ncbi:MAG: GntR family transcriptional regulator [Clostridia bacterium]|nr:GntR family transcriptional regulator [Clostridia bacterium]MDD4799142.1 GntR family transcriptional regulator [Clostridia bacterium]
MQKMMTKNEFAYETIKEKILCGELKDGDKIIISEISRELAISDIPVREAIRRLDSEKLVEIIPHLGARVCKMDLRQFAESMLVRAELEALAIKKIDRSALEPSLPDLAETLKHMKEAANNEDVNQYFSLAQQLCFSLFAKCKNEVLYEEINSFWEKTQRLRSVYFFIPGIMQVSFDMYQNFFEQLKNNHLASAAGLLKKYRADTVRKLSREIKKHPINE